MRTVEESHAREERSVWTTFGRRGRGCCGCFIDRKVEASWDISGNMVGYEGYGYGQKVKRSKGEKLLLSMTFGVWTCVDSSWRIPQYDGVWGHFSVENEDKS